MKRQLTSQIRQIIAPATVIFGCYLWAAYMMNHVGTLIS